MARIGITTGKNVSDIDALQAVLFHRMRSVGEGFFHTSDVTLGDGCKYSVIEAREDTFAEDTEFMVIKVEVHHENN